MTLSQLLELVERDYRINGRTSTRTLRNAIRHLKEHLPEASAEKISAAQIEEYKDARLDEDAAPSTVNGELSCLRRAYTLGIEQELIDHAPRIKNLRVQNTREGFLEVEDFQRLRLALEVLDPAVADAITWMYGLGWRRSEVLGLTWYDVDRSAGMVALPAARSKNRTSRRIPLSQALIDVLDRRWELRKGEYVFHREGRPIRWFRGAWRRATLAIGYPGLIPHDLRRSFARNALLAGVPQKVIMHIAGWKSARTFERYAIVDERPIAQAMEQISTYVRIGKVAP